ncbi:Hsp70 family protein [Litorivicinus lipolyticus]|uniref:Hsp70 family protein n=1 Tax=Litorivicinus lipolyticus TaxID=418701 RepID=A0A5Q2QB26_9GAMM|nr:rod shape-determining protein [Litorivicinus lipolyticus]QGG80473.1 Hsp70 family protein [Litorivicinus lipolyticus]
MHCGIDYGTSNSSIGHADNDDGITLYTVDGDSTQLPSVIWAPRQSAQLDPAQLEVQIARETARAIEAHRRQQPSALDAATRVEIEQRAQALSEQRQQLRTQIAEQAIDDVAIRDAQRACDQEATAIAQLRGSHAEVSPAQRLDIEQQVRRRVIRRMDSAAQSEQSFAGLPNLDHAIYGAQALAQHLNDPSNGLVLKSPKSLLASAGHYRTFFVDLIGASLERLKSVAETQAASTLDSVVLGRPVHWSTTHDRQKDAVAKSIMAEAAETAGFTAVEFELEPIAAARNFERSLRREAITLVVDIGGGTTDISMLRLGGTQRRQIGRTDDVLGFSGVRKGGNDLDAMIAFFGVCRRFGKQTLGAGGVIDNRNSPLSAKVFGDLCNLYDVAIDQDLERQAAKLDERLKGLPVELVKRLGRFQTLIQRQLRPRLLLESEAVKKALTGADCVDFDMSYIEPSLAQTIDSGMLPSAWRTTVASIRTAIDRCQSDAGVDAEHILITGGSARSTHLIQLLFDPATRARVVHQDLAGDVAKGLCLSARETFG